MTTTTTTTTATLADLLPELTWTPADADTDGYRAADYFPGVDWSEPVTDRAASLLALLDAYRGSDSDGVGLSHPEWSGWVAYACPEIADEAMLRLGARATADEAAALLPIVRGERRGQIQQGTDGAVTVY